MNSRKNIRTAVCTLLFLPLLFLTLLRTRTRPAHSAGLLEISHLVGEKMSLRGLVHLNDGIILQAPGGRAYLKGLALTLSKTDPQFYCFTFHPSEDIYVSKRMMSHGFHDPHVLQFLKQAIWHERELRKDHECHIIDAGANIGVVSLYAAALGCQVYSFEMQSRATDLLKLSINFNGFNDLVHLYQGVIYSKSGMHFDMSVHAPTDNVGGVSMMLSEPEEGPASDDHSQVNTVVIQEKVDSVDSIAAMKIDVEGAERLVLETTAGLWKLGKIPHIIMETRAAQAGLFAPLFHANYVCGFDDKLYAENNYFVEALVIYLTSKDFVDCFCHLRGREFVFKPEGTSQG